MEKEFFWAPMTALLCFRRMKEIKYEKVLEEGNTTIITFLRILIHMIYVFQKKRKTRLCLTEFARSP